MQRGRPPEESIACTGLAVVGQRAFSNSNGLGLGLLYTPPTSSGALAAHQEGHASSSVGEQPLWLALLIDVSSMDAAALRAAADGLSQAASTWPASTAVLLGTVDRAISFLDLRAASPQSWVLHGGKAAGSSAAAVPHIAHNVQLWARPLSECLPQLQAALGALHTHDRQRPLAQRLESTALALDIALHLLTSSIATLDAKAQQQQWQQQQQQQEQRQDHAASTINNTRVVLITAGGHAAAADTSLHTHAVSTSQQQQQQKQQQQQQQQRWQQQEEDLDRKQAAQLQELFASVGAKAADLDIPLDCIAGAANDQLLSFMAVAASASRGKVLLQPGFQPPFATNVAAAVTRRVGWDGIVDVRVPAGVKVVQLQGAVDSNVRLSSSAAAGLSPNAVAVPCLEHGQSFAAALELTRDATEGQLPFEVECRWTAADGKRMRQVSALRLRVVERLADFLNALDVRTASLLLCRRLVTEALRCGRGPWGLSRGQVEDSRLAVGAALAHVAQRMGHVRQTCRGFLGFGTRQVHVLPRQLLPLAVVLYQLQRGQLLGPNPTLSPSGHALLMRAFMDAGPEVALRTACPCLFVYKQGSSSFDVVPPMDMAIGPSTLAVLDCGDEVLVYVGEDLQGTAALEQQQQQPRQQRAADAVQSQQQHGPGLQAAGRASPVPPRGLLTSTSATDLAMASAPAVHFAKQLARGRVPVPNVRILDGSQAAPAFAARLVPLHSEDMEMQIALLPQLQQLTPQQHGSMLELHQRWAARLAGEEEASLTEWCLSFDIVLPEDASRETG